MIARWKEGPAAAALLLGVLLALGGCATTDDAAPETTPRTRGETAAAPAAPADTPTRREAVPPQAEEQGQPPLLDRKLFFDDPQLSGAQISPDGRFISFRKPYRDVMNIWVKQREEPFDRARPVTADTERPVRGYFWSEDSRYLLYVQDKGGNENFHVYAVDPTAAPEADTGVPPARDLTPYENVQARIAAVPERTPGTILVALNDRDPALHDLYRVDIATGERELLVRNESGVIGFQMDLAGTPRLALRQTDTGGTEILRVSDGEVGEPIYSCPFGDTCAPLRFHKNGRQVYILSNKGDRDLTALMLMDPETGTTEFVEEDPEGEVDLSGALFSDATEELAATVYIGDRQRIYPKIPKFEQLLSDLEERLPDGELGFNADTEDERYFVVSVGRDVDPGSVYLYDAQSKRAEKLYESRPDLPEQHLAKMRPVRYPARDGEEIPAYLTLPPGKGEKSLPVIIYPHGGPWARDTWGYDPSAQFLANRGYAVLQPNFRGSTGYGKNFLNAGNKTWGTGLMQHDISDGVKWLVDEGIADPDRVGIMGGSYGGYATLAGLAFTPGLYDAGVSIVGPSNIITLLESIPPYWGPIRKQFLLRVGDPDDPEEREQLVAQSPFFHATEIEDPLLVIQGANDPRVKKAESDQIVVALRDLEREVEYIVAPDEGHGFAGRDNRLAMFAAIEEFLAEHLGGRYQETMAPEVQARLTAMTVDPATVEMPQPKEGAEEAATAPLPTVDQHAFAEQNVRYTTSIELPGDRTIDLTSDTRWEQAEVDGRPVWRVTQVTQTPQGEAKDVLLLHRESLVPIRRTIDAPGASFRLEYGERAVSGAIEAGGQQVPIDTPLEAPVLAGGTGLETFMTALPLLPGYSTTLRAYDPQQRKVQLVELTVEDAETVTTSAGEFEALKVHVEPLDESGAESTYWITQERPRTVVKVEGKLSPQQGGLPFAREATSIER
jgi:dipeptidyl aminopeptidase/acylaminoacyl peptidase